MNSNTRVWFERCSRLIKKTLSRLKSTFAVHLVGLNNLHTLFEKDKKISKKVTFHNWIETRQLLMREVGLFFNKE